MDGNGAVVAGLVIAMIVAIGAVLAFAIMNMNRRPPRPTTPGALLGEGIGETVQGIAGIAGVS